MNHDNPEADNTLRDNDSPVEDHSLHLAEGAPAWGIAETAERGEILAEIDALWGAGNPSMTVDEIDRVVADMRAEWDERGFDDPRVRSTL